MAALVFMDDSGPGISRKKMRERWAYFDPAGCRIRQRDEVDRLNAIALPPAYVDAWFAPHGRAHLQATGYDTRRRKQYRYHPDYRAQREARKFDNCLAFAEALPDLRKRVASDVARSGMGRDRAIACVIGLLDDGQIRIGNEIYAKTNKSFGATTLRTRHATFENGVLHLRFKGKSGRDRDISCNERALVTCVRKMQDLPGQHLFQFVDEDGTIRHIASDDVNGYLHETMGDEFTARNFRTWAASSLAFASVFEDRSISLKAMMEVVSNQLGNTPAVARKSYVHPAVIAATRQDSGLPPLPEHLPRRTQWLSREERGLMQFLADAPSAANFT